MKQILAIIVLLMPSVVLACSCKENDMEVLYNQSSHVFSAEVTTTHLKKIKFWPREVDLIEAEFNVIEYFKKGNNEINIVRDLSWGAGNCSIGLMSGLEFVFFIAKEQGKIKNYVNMCSGTYPIHLKKSDFQNRFDRLRSFGKK